LQTLFIKAIAPRKLEFLTYIRSNTGNSRRVPVHQAILLPDAYRAASLLRLHSHMFRGAIPSCTLITTTFPVSGQSGNNWTGLVYLLFYFDR